MLQLIDYSIILLGTGDIYRNYFQRCLRWPISTCRSRTQLRPNKTRILKSLSNYAENKSIFFNLVRFLPYRFCFRVLKTIVDLPTVLINFGYGGCSKFESVFIHFYMPFPSKMRLKWDNIIL